MYSYVVDVVRSVIYLLTFYYFTLFYFMSFHGVWEKIWEIKRDDTRNTDVIRFRSLDNILIDMFL